MTVTHYYTQNWIICSYEDLKLFLEWVSNKDRVVNPLLTKTKVLLVESGLGMRDSKPKEYEKNKTLLSMLSRLLSISRHLDTEFIILTNAKLEYIDPAIRRYVDKAKEW